MERAFYRRLWRGFLARYESLLSPDLLELGRNLEQRFETYGRLYPGNRTVTHGDYRLDNLLIGDENGTPTITVVDWQTVGIGCGALDVAYFIGAGLLPEVRRKHERDLVRRYHEALQAGGVRDYSFDQLWEDYRWYAYAGYVMAVVATTLVVQTERGDEMFLTMARRHGQHAIDMESEKLLEAAGEG
jgi:aminoglycoside phosphotransferase (APT) family kinase protein